MDLDMALIPLGIVVYVFDDGWLPGSQDRLDWARMVFPLAGPTQFVGNGVAGRAIDAVHLSRRSVRRSELMGRNIDNVEWMGQGVQHRLDEITRRGRAWAILGEP